MNLNGGVECIFPGVGSKGIDEIKGSEEGETIFGGGGRGNAWGVAKIDAAGSQTEVG